MNDSRARRVRTIGRALCPGLALLACVLGLGAPGLGWMLGALALIAAAVWSRRIGKRRLAFVLAVSVGHLFTLGPLASTAGASAMPVPFLVIFVLVPVLAGLLALFMPASRTTR